MLVQKLFNNISIVVLSATRIMSERLSDMQILIFAVSATCYDSTAFYPDAERVIRIRSGNSELTLSAKVW